METGNSSSEKNTPECISLIEAISDSQIGMTLSCTGDGLLVLVHMYEEDMEGEGHIFGGTYWLKGISIHIEDTPFPTCLPVPLISCR